MGKIDLSINKEGLAHNIKKAKENGIIIPTIAEMQHPETIPEKIQEKLKSVGMWDVNPLNLFRITISGPEETQVLRACAVVRRSLDPWIKPRQHGPDGPEVLGPAPAPILKINNRYRYRVLVKCRNDKEIRAILAQILRAAQQDRANKGLSILIDVDPMDG